MMLLFNISSRPGQTGTFQTLGIQQKYYSHKYLTSY